MIAGSRNSYIATLVERQSRYVLLAKIPDKNTDGVVAALVRQVQHQPRELRRSLTWDRGKELADHKRLTLATDLSVQSQVKLDAVARELNERPRKTLNYHSPAEKFAQCVAEIG